MKLSLLTTYRKRGAHLKNQIAWWHKQLNQDFLRHCEILLIEVDEIASLDIKNEIIDLPIRYIHCPCSDTFHKTKALNLGLSMAKGNWIVPFDVDLIPIGNTLLRQLEIASKASNMLTTGYRIMFPLETIEVDAITNEVRKCTIAPEDMPTALWKNLTTSEKFGVAPFFKRSRLQEIGGWDENFIGWGAEDQDIIERYLQDDYALCRCPELVYLHLFHQRETQWSELSLVEKNRSYYYQKIARRNLQ